MRYHALVEIEGAPTQLFEVEDCGYGSEWAAIRALGSVCFKLRLFRSGEETARQAFERLINGGKGKVSLVPVRKMAR